jgi:hypothetical protein
VVSLCTGKDGTQNGGLPSFGAKLVPKHPDTP